MIDGEWKPFVGATFCGEADEDDECLTLRDEIDIENYIIYCSMQWCVTSF